MDDFILLLPSKEECIKKKEQIEIFLEEELHLTLNSKSRYYPDKMGIDFCGYRTFPTHRLLRNNSKKKIKRNVKKWNHFYNIGNIDIYTTMQSLNSWLGHVEHCNSYKLKNKVLNSCNFLLNNKAYEHIEKELINLIENDSKNNN